MAIVWISWQRSHTNHKAFFVGTDDAHFDATLMSFMGFAFGNAFHFRRLHAVHLAMIFPLLLMNALAKSSK